MRPKVLPTDLMSRRWWLIGSVLGVLTVGAGFWGYFAAHPGHQSPLEAVTYFWLPLLILITIVGSSGRRPLVLLSVVALLDVEAALLGAGPLVALPFIVAVPLLGVGAATRLVPASRMPVPYVAAWVASSTGVTIAVLTTINRVDAPALSVIPAFMVIDAMALAMLWRIDTGRVSALQMLSELVVSSPLPTLVLSLDRRVRLWNPAAAELLGWTEIEVAGKPLPQALYWNNRWTLGRAFVRALSGQPPSHGIFELGRRDGGVVRVRLYGGALLDRDGKPMSVGLQAVDVTSLLAIEGQLRQAQKMEAIGQLAGGIAHDFNNLLTAIRGFAELHLLEHPPGDQGRDDVLEIEHAAERAAQLTQGLLAFSRRADVHPGPLDLAQAASGAVVLLRRLVGENIVVRLDAARELPCVLADPVQIEQVLLNLAANARDAMPEGGELRLTVKAARISPAFVKSHPGAQAGRHILLEVSDTGVGIDKATKEHLFEPYFTTKPPGEGTGLGLASVYGIVKQAHGYIDVESHRSGGSAFRIYLPELKDARPQIRVKPGPGRDHNGGNESILLVEDEATVRLFAQRVLRAHGYRVIAFGDPGLALQAVIGNPGAFDALVTDVKMPIMSGPTLAERVAAVRPTLPVLFMTGYEEDALPAAAPPPLKKPFGAQGLVDAVGALFGRID